ncbi:hypothetical protein BX281_0119 [Streptomyces sp. Ag82_O1-15]|uniref:hypothetical protein n=1 Tax=Streptomyces sp. Ag82_O1-15 TaxID=1938855 RepID=UPI000BCB8ECC|nr:hypothetical protein [Streptomyces sp. Ag82_O1-15]PBC92464.1 hypothetical protein BX281_0119 [Streptomyces sp. Ag82_O1-15]
MSVPYQSEPEHAADTAVYGIPDVPPAEDPYTVPELIPLGRTSDIIRNDIDGHLADGTGGWYVWNS